MSHPPRCSPRPPLRFQIPMRGNELQVEAERDHLRSEFQIPMRGNERVCVREERREPTVSNPHEG